MRPAVAQEFRAARARSGVGNFDSAVARPDRVAIELAGIYERAVLLSVPESCFAAGRFLRGRGAGFEKSVWLLGGVRHERGRLGRLQRTGSGGRKREGPARSSCDELLHPGDARTPR